MEPEPENESTRAAFSEDPRHPHQQRWPGWGAVVTRAPCLPEALGLAWAVSWSGLPPTAACSSQQESGKTQCSLSGEQTQDATDNRMRSPASIHEA